MIERKACLTCKHSFTEIKKGDHSACLECNDDRNMHIPIQSTDTETILRIHDTVVPGAEYGSVCAERDELSAENAKLRKVLEGLRQHCKLLWNKASAAIGWEYVHARGVEDKHAEIMKLTEEALKK